MMMSGEEVALFQGRARGRSVPQQLHQDVAVAGMGRQDLPAGSGLAPATDSLSTQSLERVSQLFGFAKPFFEPVAVLRKHSRAVSVRANLEFICELTGWPARHRAADVDVTLFVFDIYHRGSGLGQRVSPRNVRVLPPYSPGMG